MRVMWCEFDYNFVDQTESGFFLFFFGLIYVCILIAGPNQKDHAEWRRSGKSSASRTNHNLYPFQRKWIRQICFVLTKTQHTFSFSLLRTHINTPIISRKKRKEKMYSQHKRGVRTLRDINATNNKWSRIIKWFARICMEIASWIEVMLHAILLQLNSGLRVYTIIRSYQCFFLLSMWLDFLWVGLRFNIRNVLKRWINVSVFYIGIFVFIFFFRFIHLLFSYGKCRYFDLNEIFDDIHLMECLLVWFLFIYRTRSFPNIYYHKIFP